MKKLNYSARQIRQAIHTTAITLALTSQPLMAGGSPEFTVTGSTVTGSGINTSSAYFSGKTDSAYNVTVTSNSQLGNNSKTVISLAQGTVTNNGTITATGSTSSAIYFNNSGTSSSSNTVINNGTVSISSRSTGPSGSVAAVEIINNNTEATDNISNSGTISSSYSGYSSNIVNIGVSVSSMSSSSGVYDTFTNAGLIISKLANSASYVGASGVSFSQKSTVKDDLSFVNSGSISTYTSGIASVKASLVNGVRFDQGNTGSGAPAEYLNVENKGSISAVSILLPGAPVGLDSSSVYGVYLDQYNGSNGTAIVSNTGSVSALSSNSELNVPATSAFGLKIFAAGNGYQTTTANNTGSISAVANLTNGSTTSGVYSYGIDIYNYPDTTAKVTVNNAGSVSAVSNLTNSGAYSVANAIYVVSENNKSNNITINNTGAISAVANSKSGRSFADGIYIPSIGNGSQVIAINNEGSISTLGTVTNSGTATASGIYVLSELNRSLSLTITNSGSITARGISGPANAFVPGIDVSIENGTATINNTGSISAIASSSSNSAYSVGYGITTTVSTLGTVTVNNSGTIFGSTIGIFSPARTIDINLDGGELAGGTGNAASINTGTVDIRGRALLVSGAPYALKASGPTGQLNLNLVGGTPAQVAAAKTAVLSNTGAFQFGGYTYSWQNFNVNADQLISLEQVCAPQYGDLAQKIDNNALPLGYDPFYISALANPNAALNELSGFTIIEGMKDIELNSQNTFLSTAETQLESLQGEGGFSTANASIGNSSIAGVNSATDQLDKLTAYADATQRLNANTSNSTDSKGMVDNKTMTPVEPSDKWTVWLAGSVALAHEDPISGAPGYNAVNGSPLMGVDYAVTPDFKAGFLAGATLDGANFGDGSKIDASTELVGLYATYHHGPWFINGLVSGGPSQYENGRPTFGGTAKSDPSGYSIATQSTIGYTFAISKNFSATPEVGIQYTHVGVDSYSETGAGIFDTNVASNDIDSLRSHLGGKLDGSFELWHDFTIIPELRAAWYHEFLDDSQGVATSLAGAPAFGSFNVNTVTTQRDYALVGVGLNSIFTGFPNFPIGTFVNYDVQAGQSNYLQHNITGGVKVAF